LETFDHLILEALESTPGLKAKDIADKIGSDKKSVNSALFGRLKTKVTQDKNYRWYIRGKQPVSGQETAAKQLDTQLARLSRYYLDCLSYDDLGGTSVFAKADFGNPDYVELPGIPMLEQELDDQFILDTAQGLINKIRSDRNRKSLLIGYPTRLRLVHSKKGWEGFMVEPIMLFPLGDDDSQRGTPMLSHDLPHINFQALRSLSNSGETNLMEEAIQLGEELGLDCPATEQPDLDELLTRLSDIRPEWDWQEEMDPYEMSAGQSLSELNEQGIYNRCVVIAAERSPYTKGLETELGMLQTVEEEKYTDSILGKWLVDKEIASTAQIEQDPLIEVLPLNSEQRQAVHQALANQLTVITGPPGTGKSQVVMSILINAAWQGKTVLFASKNNKAVDVVETRVNAIGSRPILLRLGTSEYQNKLAEFLISLLSARATEADASQYQEHIDIHQQLTKNSEQLDRMIKELIDLRNEVDRQEQLLEPVRDELGQDQFLKTRQVDSENICALADSLAEAIGRADKSRQTFATKTIWPVVQKGRLEALSREVGKFSDTAEQLALPFPNAEVNKETVEVWIAYGQQLSRRIAQVEDVQTYFATLSELTKMPSLEDLSLRRLELVEELTDNSEALWNAWLRLQPARLDFRQRKLLGDYSSVLQLMVSASGKGQRLERDVFRKYYQLFPQITNILPCWAVTSLSARGRVPFEDAYFDLLVIDEASQCDIASALPLLFRSKRAVIIGDPMQLRHISTLSKAQDQQLMTKHNLIDDFLGWTYSTRSLFDLAASVSRSEDIVALRDHHRSHADIIGFSNQCFYEDRLRVATNYKRLKMPSADQPAIRWVDIKGSVVRPGSGGAVNDKEANAVIEEIMRLVEQGYGGTIGVVSPFRAQANRIRDLAYKNGELIPKLGELELVIDTVHRFQGDERDLIIFSPVVSKGISRGAVTFLRNTPNLFNVAVTRARACLIVVGDCSSILDCEVEYLSRFAEYATTVTNRDPFAESQGIEDLGFDYPPVSNPELVSDWEKILYRALYKEGIQTIPQYSVEKYILDLALISSDRRLDIEVDGERYHRNWDGEICCRDRIRNQRLNELGWDVMRFWVYQIRDEIDDCIARINKWKEKAC
jgi:very-short-patch-repair endonuclease